MKRTVKRNIWIGVILVLLALSPVFSGCGAEKPTPTKAANLGVTNTVDNLVPNVGGSVTYTITLTNSGPGDATGITVSDILPAGVTYVFNSVSQGSYDSGTGNWTVGGLSNGSSVTLTITATVNQGTGGQTISDTASIAAFDQEDSNPDNNNATASFTVLSADLGITNAVDNSTPNVGGNVTYTITLTNYGPNDDFGITISDILPTGVTYVSNSASQGTYNSGTGKWTVSSLNNGSSATLVITASVNQGTGGQTISATASVTAAELEDNNSGNNSATVNITVQSADLGVTNTVDNPTPNVGGNVTYTITLTNNGPSNATGIIVSDILPAGMTYVSNSASQGTYDSDTGKWTVGSLSNGSSATLTITVSVNQGTGGQTISDTASMTAADQQDSNSANNSATASITVQSADLGVTNTVDNPTPNVGGNVTYTITLTNSGPGNATGITVSDILPAGVTYVSNSASQGAYDSGTGKWAMNNFDNGASATLTITVSVNQGTGGQMISNTASVTAADQQDNNSANNSATANFTVLSADLGVTNTVDNPTPNAGDNVTYTITLTNYGPNDDFGITVSDILPAGVTYVSNSASQGTYDSGTGKWTMNNLDNGASATLTITVSVNEGTGGQTISNTASVTAADQQDSNSANNSATASFTVLGADLGVTNTVDNPTPNVSDNVTYAITLTNYGPNDDIGIMINDILPAGVTYVSNSASQGSYDSGTGDWTVGDLSNSSSATLTITVSVNSGTEGQTIDNADSVTAAELEDNNSANNSATASFTVQGATP